MNPITWTNWFIVGNLFLSIGFDVFIAYMFGRQATISYQIWIVAYAHPIIPFAVGVLMGHLFWREDI